MTDYSTISIEQVIYLHEKIIERAGGKQGVRDYTLLHSGLERCKATFAGRDLYPSLEEKASALMHSLVKNHAFLDGNKRTAWQVTKRFLYINNLQFQVSQQEIIDFCLSIDNHGWDVPDILQWIKKHTSRAK